MENTNINNMEQQKTAEQITAEIAAASSIDEIIQIIDNAGVLKGSDGETIDSEKLKDYIKNAELSVSRNTSESTILTKICLRGITRNYGLREKVKELLGIK